MFNRFRHELRDLRCAKPGNRFIDGHRRTRIDNHALRITLIIVGLMLMFSAAVTFWIPGPNFILVLAGLALVGGQSRLVALGLDRLEVTGRRWHDERWKPYQHKRAAIVSLAVIAALIVAVAGYAAWRHGLIPYLQALILER